MDDAYRLRKNEMPDGTETRAAPGVHEKMDAVPRVEADAEGCGLEHAMNLIEGRTKPPGIVVVGNGATVAGAVIDEIGRSVRGLFVSYSGFTEEGLDAFAHGNATRIICIEGQELWQVLNHHLDLDLADVLARKTRRAAEAGKAFVSVGTLYSL